MLNILLATFEQMTVFFIIIVTGYFLSKKRFLPENTDAVLSKLLSRVVMSALCFNTFSNNFKVENIKTNLGLFVCGAVVLLVTLFAGRLLAPLFAKDKYVQNIYTYSLTISNLGYMGYPISQAVFGDKAMFNMMVFCIPFSMFIYSFGYAMLNPLNKKVTFKSLVNPTFFGMILGAIVGLFNIKLPTPVSNALSMVAVPMAFLAMIVTGFVIAKYPFKEIIYNKKVYVASFLRLVAIPSVVVTVLKLLNLPQNYILSALCALSMPLGLNTVVFPASYGADTRHGASMALISTLGAMITIPLMLSVFGG